MHKALSRSLRVIAVLATVLLTSCGTFQLSSGAIPITPKTQEQQQLDTLSCKDQARLEASTAGRQTGAFLLGMTIVGAPLAFELEKSKQREVYKTCMEARGYRVLPPADQAAAAPQTTGPQPTLQAVPPPPPPATQQTSPPPTSTTTSSSNRDEAAQLQKLKELRDKGLISDDEYQRKRKEILDRL